MGRTTSVDRRAAEALVGVLEQMLAELVGATGDGDAGWLRPLAVLIAEIEYSAVRSPEVDSTNLADECRELSDLLGGSSRAGAEFATRYSVARGTSPVVAALHDRAISACRRIVPSTEHGVP
jgi:hypothetical protein